MNTYEITYIISPKAADEERDRLNSELEQKIASMEGKIEHASAALRRPLSYEIKKERAGFLRTISVSLDPAHIAAIQEWLKRNGQVLRFNILNTPYRPEITPETIREMIAAEKKPVVKDTKKPEKEVTMEDVEKGIEDALTEEVK